MFDIASLEVWVAGLLLGLFARGQSEAFAVHLEDVNMMGESVKQHAGEAFGTKGVNPIHILELH